MDILEYSIVYAEIRPEIKERVSVGIIFCQGSDIEVRYSNAKLHVVKNLIPSVDYDYLRRSLISMSTKNTVNSIASVEYLNRYSNNILTVSEVRKVKSSAVVSKNKLYRMYVYNGQS